MFHQRQKVNFTTDQMLAQFASPIQRKLAPEFSKEKSGVQSVWPANQGSSGRINFERLELVKRPPNISRGRMADKLPLFKTCKSKEIPENRVRSKKPTPAEKYEHYERRRGSFDLISTDEEFDGNLV